MATPPKITRVDVVATQPSEADRGALAHLSAQAAEALPEVTHIVRIALEEMMPATGEGWALYVGDERIPRYWAYKEGIFFKVFDPAFLANHNGQPLRFSQDGVNFVDTGKKLTQPKPVRGARPANAALPTLEAVLK